MEVATTFSAQEERLEGVPMERLALRRGADMHGGHRGGRRTRAWILDGVLLRSEVAREFISVPGEQPELEIEWPVQ